jgi:hypothetical protein
MQYQGSCHCGNIQFKVEGDFGAAVSCNCSICQRKGTAVVRSLGQISILNTKRKNLQLYL